MTAGRGDVDWCQDRHAITLAFRTPFRNADDCESYNPLDDRWSPRLALTQRPSRAQDLALLLLRHEGVSDASDSEVTAAAADHVLRRLQTELSRWFGSEGFQALLLRALDRTRPGYPALARVIPRFAAGGAGPHGLDGLLSNLQQCSPEETRDALVAVIAAVIALLGRLVGDDVAIRLVAQGWPELLRGEPRSTDEGTRE